MFQRGMQMHYYCHTYVRMHGPHGCVKQATDTTPSDVRDLGQLMTKLQLFEITKVDEPRDGCGSERLNDIYKNHNIIGSFKTLML